MPEGATHTAPKKRTLVYPTGGKHKNASTKHETEGLAGYPAMDFFAPPGTHVVAIEDGVIRKLSGHPTEQGPISGPHGPFGWSIYLHAGSGEDFYYTHLATRTVKLGAHVKAGQVIGTVANYAKWTGTPNHTHVGVHGGHTTIENVRDAPQLPV
jgi:murein DD-endopeptidase MepM/ murein hydrolase activator NlpD